MKENLPVMTDHLCAECSEHFASLQRILGEMGISFVHDPLLVRGLDYYTRTAFEILHPGLGGQNALCGGGRYDGLAEDCGAGPVPAIGFSAGIERLLENMPDKAAVEIDFSKADIFFVVPQKEGYARAMNLASQLRDRGMRVEVDLNDLVRDFQAMPWGPSVTTIERMSMSRGNESSSVWTIAATSWSSPAATPRSPRTRGGPTTRCSSTVASASARRT